METLIDWDALAQFLASHIIELIIGGGTTATAIGVAKVRSMLVEQISVQTIVFSEAAGQQLAIQLQNVTPVAIKDDVINIYRDALNRLHELTAPQIDNNVAAQLTVKIKTITAIVSRAVRDNVISQDAAKTYEDFERRLLALIVDLVGAGRKADRHRRAVDEINELLMIFLAKLGFPDEKRDENIGKSNIMPGASVLLRFFLGGRRDHTEVRF